MKMIIMIMMKSRLPSRVRHPPLSSRHYPQSINPGCPRTPQFCLVQWIQKRVDHHDNGANGPQIVRCASIARAGWTWPMVLDLSMGSKLFLHLLSASFIFLYVLLFCVMRQSCRILCPLIQHAISPLLCFSVLSHPSPPFSYIFLHFLISKFMIHYMNKIPTRISIL